MAVETRFIVSRGKKSEKTKENEEKSGENSEKPPEIPKKPSKKPSIDEVIKYAKPLLMKFISQYASTHPKEQKEEIEQTGYVRILQAYKGLDPDAGWKSYVYNHCRGAVLDYIKFGVGFQEDKWTIAKEEAHGSRNISKIRQRLCLVHDDNEMSLDHALGSYGIFSELGGNETEIRWELVARLARIDDSLHAFSLWLRGYHIEEIGPVFSLSRARVGQMILEFVESLKKPNLNDYWFRQVLYAFNLCEHYNIKDMDQSRNYECKIGWQYTPVDLESLKPKYPNRKDKHVQMELF